MPKYIETLLLDLDEKRRRVRVLVNGVAKYDGSSVRRAQPIYQRYLAKLKAQVRAGRRLR